MSEKITLRDIYKAVNSLEIKVDSRINRLDDRVNSVETKIDNVIGKIAIGIMFFSGVISAGIAFIFQRI